jgi:hypothetical protein
MSTIVETCLLYTFQIQRIYNYSYAFQWIALHKLLEPPNLIIVKVIIANCNGSSSPYPPDNKLCTLTGGPVNSMVYNVCR